MYGRIYRARLRVQLRDSADLYGPGLLCRQLQGVFNLAIKALLMIVVFIFILQSFFYPGNDILWSWSIFSIKREGLEFALFLTSKIVAVASAFILFFRITKVRDLVHSWNRSACRPK